jgi:hypothetical protein
VRWVGFSEALRERCTIKLSWIKTLHLTRMRREQTRAADAFEIVP